MKNRNTIDYTGMINREIFSRDSSFVMKQKIVYKAPDKLFAEMLRPEGKRSFTLVRIGKRIYFKRPEDDVYKLRRGDSRRSPEGEFYVKEKWGELLKKNYSIIRKEDEEIADRLCYPVNVKSRHEGRPSIKAWIDKENGFILKMERYNAENELTYRSAYETIDFMPSINEKLFDIEFKEEKERRHRRSGSYDSYDSYDSLNKDVRAKLMKVNYIPVGFVLDRIIVMERRGYRFYHLTYTDGFNTVSLFQRKIDRSSERRDRSHQRGDQGRREERRGGSLIIREDKGKYNISIIGNLSVLEMRKIFSSIEI